METKIETKKQAEIEEIKMKRETIDQAMDLLLEAKWKLQKFEEDSIFFNNMISIEEIVDQIGDYWLDLWRKLQGVEPDKEEPF